jgi:putative iron-dependent peroxidase
MTFAQPGIFALGTRSHYQLELDWRPGGEVADLVAALCEMRGATMTSGGVNVVLGFSARVWEALAPPGAAVSFHDFAPIDGLDHKKAPATQHDLWVWIHGTGHDVALDVARGVALALAPVADVAVQQPCFVYKDSRDLTGFIDGSANPPIEEAPYIACIPDGEAGAGGTFVITQRWVHDLGAFHALEVGDQEKVFARTKPDSVEFDDDAKPATAHIARMEVDGEDGEELEIFRRSVPYGEVGEVGLYFLAFSAEQSRFDTMLARMFGTSGDGIRDQLLDFTRPVTGSYYFAPSLDDLNTVLAVDPDGDGDED